MTVSALIQYTQGATITPAGRAMVGTIGGIVTCANDNDAGVTAWLWTMESVPLGSAVPTGPMATTPTIGFVPDIAGSYLVSCHVTGANTTDVDTDYRVFSVRNTMQWIIPAFHGNADAHNFGGQTRGWAGTATYQMLDSLFGYITTMLSGAVINDVLTFNGSVWGPAQPAVTPPEPEWTGTTTDGTTPVLLTDSGGDWYVLTVPATYCSATFCAFVNGIGSADGSQCSAILCGSIRRGVAAGTTVILDQFVNYIVQDGPTMSVTAVADTTLGGLQIYVVGKAAVDMAWKASVEISESLFPIL